MNVCHFSGWLPFDADSRITGRGDEVLSFTMIVTEDGKEDLIKAYVNQPAIIAKYRAHLVKGRIVSAATFTMRRMPHIKNGGIAGESVVFYLQRAEFGSRSKEAPRVITPELLAAAQVINQTEETAP